VARRVGWTIANVVASTFLEPDPVAAADLLGAVANPVRWRLLAVLSDGATRCVCQLQPVAGVHAGLLSYHLRVLREAGLVRTARRGTWVDYTITAGALDRLHTALPVPVPGPSPGAGEPVTR
jgi:ArsR family transcriptional regulator